MSSPAQDALPRNSVVVYTAITGRYDSLKEQPASARADADFVAFLDEPRRSRTWQWRAIHAASDDPARNAKIHKVLPHKYFPEVRYSLWLDGSVRILSPHSIRPLIQLYLADYDLVVFPHRNRTCVYQEASVCLHRRLDDPEVIWAQVCRYQREDYPPNAGLAECAVILRRHTPAVNAFNEAWWNEITRGSRRDQLSFPYVARKVGLRYGTFPWTLDHTPVFERGRHATPLVARLSHFAKFGLDRFASGLYANVGVAIIAALSRRGSASREVPSWRRRAIAALTGGSGPNWARRAPFAGRPLSATPAGYEIGDACRSTNKSQGVDSQSQSSTSVHPRGRRVVAIGPVREVPSWDWVGFDTARALSEYYDIVVYDSWHTPPACDALLIIKQRPPKRFLAAAEKARQKIVYCPVDTYRHGDQFARDAHMLRACAMVLVHCERLLPLVTASCSNSHFVEHHTRYALNSMAAYKETGFVLWVGGYQYVPYLLKWLEDHPIGHEIKILTDVDKYWSRDRARLFAAEIGTTLRTLRDRASIAGHALYPWSERLQDEMMRECKAAFDIKWPRNFNQDHKPPTKAQQFIASGIPFAVNLESYSAEYFRRRGFEVASPAERTRWFSREYWEATRAFGEQLRASTSLRAVGTRYRELIETLWTDAG